MALPMPVKKRAVRIIPTIQGWKTTGYCTFRKSCAACCNALDCRRVLAAVSRVAYEVSKSFSKSLNSPFSLISRKRRSAARINSRTCLLTGCIGTSIRFTYHTAFTDYVNRHFHGPPAFVGLAYWDIWPLGQHTTYFPLPFV
jgi:hypothetical protein